MPTITKEKQKILMPEMCVMRGEERLMIWEKIRGMWKNKKPDPIRELQKMRREGERKLPSLR